jgi:predicted nucleic acid-binding protein
VRMVLDASIALSWLLEDAGAGQDYAGAVFDALATEDAEARVPATWGLEVANVIAKIEARGLLPNERTQTFLAAIAAAPIVCDPETYSRTLTDTLALARRYRLSAYDASYLELALRAALPLATLDQELQRAAASAGVKLVKPTKLSGASQSAG